MTKTVAMVGREQEMAALRVSLDSAVGGSPRVVVCSGEPGVGKTRLAEELGRMAADRAVWVAWGRGVEDEGAPPYWPWRQVLRGITTHIDVPAISAAHRLTNDLAGLAPDMFPAPNTPGDGSREARFRQFDAMARLLRFLSEQQPLMIVLDDAHWADHSSLLLLRHLVRAVTDERLLIVVNHRDMEPLPGSVLAELVRAPVSRQFLLRGLTVSEVGRQLAAVVGRAVPDEDVHSVHSITGGNPLFVGELGRVLAEQGDGLVSSVIPIRVRQAIDLRLQRLSGEAFDLLRAASIVGHQFSVAIVAGMMGLPVLTCLAPLDEAIATGLVCSAADPGEHLFVHALFRDAIEDGLGTAERARLHRLAAEAIEEFHAGWLDSHLSDIARHWAVAALAGDRHRAAHWIARAGREAIRRLAYEEGARLYRSAVTIGAGELSAVDRCCLFLATGEALHLSADIPGRLQACLDAAEIARRIDRPDLLARAALVLEGVLESASDRAAQQLCIEALAGLGPAPTALAAAVTARLADTSSYLGDTDAAQAASKRALEMAEQCRDSMALKAALSTRQMLCSGPEGSDERARLALQMLAIGSESRDPHSQLSAHIWQIDVEFERGNLVAAARETDRLAYCVEEVGGPLARWQLLRIQAALAQSRAQFAQAHRLAEQAHQAISATGHPFDYTTWVSLLASTGHHVGHGAAGSRSLLVAGLIDELPGSRRTHTPTIIDAVGQAAMLIESGRSAEAADRYRNLGPVAGWRPAPVVALVSYAFAVHVAAALTATADLAALRELLAPYRGLHIAGRGGAVYYCGPVELYLGVAAAHLDLLDDAVVELDHAARSCAANGAAGFHAEAQCELAAVLAKRAAGSDTARARALLAECGQQAAALGMTPWVGRIRELGIGLGGRPDPLTRREREVAELVTNGLTNREIAERLYLSERTAQNHVQHVLGKLNLSNRSQIAVWVTTHAGR